MNSAAYQRNPANAAIAPNKRAVILHDFLSFLVLTLITVALFGVTLFLFRSFETRREDLSKRWAGRGRVQLQQRQPEQAIVSLRAALSYVPDDYQSELLLAQALADSGQTDQATNYFLSMWTTRPGDGFLNLQLARLARSKNDSARAIPYYRASIYGDWRGDGSIKRRDVRLELVDYLTSLNQPVAARAELLIAAGNAPDNLPLNLLLAARLADIGDGTDALTYYRRAIVDDPRNAVALSATAHLEYGRGNYTAAHEILERLEQEQPAAMNDGLRSLARDTSRLIELSLSRELPAGERARHILADARIAQARLNACVPRDTALEKRWHDVGDAAKRNALAASAEGQDTLTELIFATERETSQAGDKTCGQPTNDDALLLKLASTQEKDEVRQ